MAVHSSSAHAQAPGQSPPGLAPTAQLETEQVTVTKRYGWQIAMVDAASLLAGVAAEDGSLVMAGFVLGGPIVHLAHGEGGRALGSAALRLTLPVIGIYLGAASADCSNNNEDDWDLCGLGEAVLGGMIGAGTAMAIDYFALATTTHTETRRRGVFEYRGVAVSPAVAPTRAGMSFGLTGSF